jgi:GNAT superfamily N-acetyltransferase
MNLNIRGLHEADIPKIAQTFCFPWTTLQESTEKWSRYFTEQQAKDRTAIIMEKEGRIIGYASLLRNSAYPFFKNESIPEINDVWIAEDKRRQGFGTMLLNHLEAMAIKEGYKKIGLGVGLYPDYGQAQKLYFSLGYEPDGKGITYKGAYVTPGVAYPVDDDLLLWLIKALP